MLSELYIRNFALIDEMRLEYGKGLNIITGETGSGKSIMIDALSLALGKKGGKNLVRKNRKKAIIEAVFYIDNEEIVELLENLGVDVEEKQLVLAREINEDGRSTSRVNGRVINQSDLKSITAQIITIHGQNEYEQLLSSANQLRLIDGFGDSSLQNAISVYHKDYERYQEVEQKLRLLNDDMDDAKIERELDLLSYEIDEIQSANLKKDEKEEIKENLLRLENSEKIKQNADYIYNSLYAEQNSVLNILSRCTDKLESIIDYLPDAKGWLDTVNDAYYTLEDMVHELRAQDMGDEHSEDLIDELHIRLDKINQLSRKYGKDYEEIMRYLESAKERKQTILSRDELNQQYRVEREEISAQLEFHAQKLTQARKKTAEQLRELIQSELESLNMKNVQFEIAFEKTERGKRGADRIEFLISFNKGESLKPLAQVASGGEISRFMLAFKTVVAKSDNIDTLIFDEIDTGVSGIAAHKIGTKLKDISNFRQVICITHLPQIASFADTHFVVEKMQSEMETMTRANLLSDEERVVEIAKMMSGDDISENALETARDLIKRNVERKNGKND